MKIWLTFSLFLVDKIRKKCYNIYRKVKGKGRLNMWPYPIDEDKMEEYMSDEYNALVEEDYAARMDESIYNIGQFIGEVRELSAYLGINADELIIMLKDFKDEVVEKANEQIPFDHTV